MGSNASTNRKRAPPQRPGNYQYPADDPYGPSPRPLDRNGPSPRPPRRGDVQPTESSFNEALNPWLDTSPIPPQPLPPYQPPAADDPRPAPDNQPYQSSVPAQAPPQAQAPPPAQPPPPAPPPPPRDPPPYRQVQAPPPIYQPVRPRPYFNQQPGYGQPPPGPNRYGYPRIQRYNPVPRYVKQPYSVEPLQYGKPNLYGGGYEAQPYVANGKLNTKPEGKLAVHDPGKTRLYQEVESLLATNFRPREEIPDEVQSKKEKDDDDYIGANLRFYRNLIRFRPQGEYIDNIHKYWFGDYKKLEENHTYIQWLFPISAQSRVNPEAVPLRQHEAKHIKDDAETKERVVKSYRMMLDYFGLALEDEESGKVTRSDKWKDRFYNFKRSHQNHFRITRIIRSIGELGFPHYQAPLVMRLLHEVYETGELQGLPPITIHYWLRTIDTDFDRDYVYNQFKEKIYKHERDFKASKNHEVNMYYYNVLPKKKRPVAPVQNHAPPPRQTYQ